MGFGRIRNITIISMFIIGEIILGEEILKIEVIDKGFKWEELILEVFKMFIGALPSLALAFYAAKKERKKREEFEKNNLKEKERILRLEWYNNLVLGKVVEKIREYYIFIDDELDKIETLTDLTEKENKIYDFTDDTRKERDKLRSYLSYIMLFDYKLYKKCQTKVLESVDVNSIIRNSSISAKKRKNKKAKDEILKLLYEYTFEVGKE